ncbi:MAG: Fic family protein [Pseudomonadota bacterium]
MVRYIWQVALWPDFYWDSSTLLEPLGRTRQAQGILLGEADYFELNMEAEVLTEDAFTTSAIEGEKLDRQSVRSSVARRLGLPTAGLPPVDRQVDGLVEMLVDATRNFAAPLTAARLKSWHASLFPFGHSGMQKIITGDWRKGKEPMQVVSGPVGKEKVHYEAPPADRVENEVVRFLEWFRHPTKKMDGFMRAAAAHFWFVTIHPFQDGNGRIARAIADMALAQDEQNGCRLYSMSAQIRHEQDKYYEVLEETQKGSGDITGWMTWFLGCLERAIRRAESGVQKSRQKAALWQDMAGLALNERQRKVVNKLFEAGKDGFEGGLTNRKYRGMTRTTRETAKRDIADLVEKGILRKQVGGGRSTSYTLEWPL